MTVRALPPISLYVHFPWCVRKCPYCDFNSHPANGNVPEDAYLNQLLAEWQMQRPALAGRKLGSVFCGGGTPSLFSPAAFDRLLQTLASDLAPAAEVTMEANPGTLECGNLADYRAAGINRLSLGVQSFDDASLLRLGRIHNADDARNALVNAQRSGFDNINIDLMHGLPQQSLSVALNDIEEAIAHGVQHISYYQLTIEPRTEFARRPPQLPAEDQLAQIEGEGLARLATAGFERYEVSAYARPGRTSYHNSNYWEFGDYLGIGAGAHGKLTSVDGTIKRTVNPRQPRLYLAGTPLEEAPVAASELPGEFMLNALRLLDGVPEERFEQRTGLPLATISEPLQRWRRRGVIHADRLALTPLGRNALDTVVMDFLPDHDGDDAG